ncbi:unnamed protein product [Malus baccata var. baccata]
MEDVSGIWSRLSSKVHHLVCQDGENETVTEYATFVCGEPSQDANGPSKVDSKADILHEKVTTQIIKEGHGQIPSKYSTCFLHYRAWTESTRHKFEDTWDEQRQLEMILGKAFNHYVVVLNAMNFLLVVYFCYCNREKSISFPNVPPVADISYEVELIGFDKTKEVSWIAAADRRKMDGNALFKDEKLEEAVKNPCHLNMAASFIKLKRYEEAIGQCSIVTLFRRGKARAELGQTGAAPEDFLTARKFAPQDKAIAREFRLLAEHDKALRLLAEHNKAVYQKQTEIYKGIFGPTPSPKPKLDNWLIIFWHWPLSLFCRLFRREGHKAE